MKKLFSSLIAVLFTLTYSVSSYAVPRTAFVHLFEWQWTDIASECENHLGPDGYAAVQVSPPQKSVSGSQWWTRYQPMSYSIEGRSGTREQFADMVSRCKAVGVDIYVDAVINHMAAKNRSFPDVPYGANDFHSCTTGIDYSNAWQVQNCDLVGLNDLKTESDYVRGKIAAYMNDLTSMGVAGFRLDAAKHIPAADVSNIVGRLTGHPYIYQEVIGAAGEPIQPSQYTYIGNVTEFNFSKTLGYYFKGRGALKDIKNIGTSSWSGWVASSDAQIFVANHDNQRQDTGNIITHKDGNNLNVLAHVFMLGWAYGYPEVMSSYDWSSSDQGPPTSGASACNNGWLCEHRIRAIKNMVAFRNNTIAKFSNTNLWDNGNNQMAWGRGGLGYVAINREDNGNLNRTFATGMPAGTYCDIIHADFDYAAGTCTGATVTVDASGNASFSVNSHDAVAFHVGAKVGVPCTSCGGNSTSTSSISTSVSSVSSVSSDKWYFRGTPNNWTATAMSLQSGLFCTDQQFGDASTKPRFKIDHNANWIESYPSADYAVSANTNYHICFNASTHAITISAVKSSSSASSVSSISSSSVVFSSTVCSSAMPVSSASSASSEPHVVILPGDDNNVISSSETSSKISNQSSSSDRIIANEPTGVMQLTHASYSVKENAKTLIVTVNRVNGSFGPASVDYNFSNGTALAGKDFTAVNGTLSFANGEMIKAITINIVDDTVVESAENFSVTLSNAIGATMGAQSTATVTIEDNDIALAKSDVVVDSATKKSSGAGATSPWLLLVGLLGLPLSDLRVRLLGFMRRFLMK